ncbi:MAG TPA: metal-dependent transcriptional regulator [Gemmatimonadales bacterium]|jgi:DtxR family Mn-dependent transcriptional regulator|nr:metal-dependent transcriptional regulator [Gemmatimonadales bacterium]
MTKSAAAAELTSSVEDYLKTVYQLTESGQAASTTGIAEALAIAAPSVSAMVKRLVEAGLVAHIPYKGVTLTGDGRRAALRMLRRHRIIETYLVSTLGYTWDNVHDEAERLEHAVSEDLVERLSRALGHPRVDPHGDPIPAADGEMIDVATTPLPDVEVGAVVTIHRVGTGSAERLRWLAAEGLVPGARLEVLEHQPFNGPVTIAINGQRRVIGRDVARHLLCVVAVPTVAGRH